MSCPYLAVVGHHYKIVKLSTATDVGAAHRRTVYRGIGTDFHIVVNLHNTKLWYLVVYSGSIGGEAKTVGSDYSTGMQYAACAYAAAVVYFHAGIKYGSVAYGHALTDIYLGEHLYALAYHSTLGNICESAHIAVVGYFNTLGDESALLYALMLGHDSFGRQRHKLCHSRIRVIHTDKCGCYGSIGHEIVAYEDYRRLRTIYIMCVLRIGEKCDSSGHSLFDFREVVDRHRGVALDRST